MSVQAVLALFAAGVVGAVARWLISRLFAGRRFPVAVLVVNIAGSAIGGAVLGFAMSYQISHSVRLVLLTGLCGGLTTFSTFSVDTVQLVLDGRTRTAVISALSNLALGIGVAWLAFAIVWAFAPPIYLLL